MTCSLFGVTFAVTTTITILASVWFPCSIWLNLVYHFFVFHPYTSSRWITVKLRNVTTILARNWLLFQFNCLLSWKTTKISLSLSLFSLSVYILQWTNFFSLLPVSYCLPRPFIIFWYYYVWVYILRTSSESYSLTRHHHADVVLPSLLAMKSWTGIFQRDWLNILYIY